MATREIDYFSFQPFALLRVFFWTLLLFYCAIDARYIVIVNS